VFQSYSGVNLAIIFIYEITNVFLKFSSFLVPQFWFRIKIWIVSR